MRKKSQNIQAIRVFHFSEQDGRRSKYGRNSVRLGQAKNRTIQNYLETSSKHSVLVRSRKLAQKTGLQFYQTRSHSIVLYNTLPAICIEKAVCMKTKEELYHKIYQSSRLPRVVLKPNSQTGQQDQPDQEARKSSDHQSVSGSYEETRSGKVDYRIPGIPHSTVQQPDTNRRESKKLIQQFDIHPSKEFVLQDLNKTEEISTFSERSKKLITDMGNTDIFELCETSSKKQCPDCASCWETGIVYCSCGRSPKPSKRTKQLDKKNHDASSFPGYVMSEPHPCCQTWSFRTATNVQQGEGDAAESSPNQAWW